MKNFTFILFFVVCIDSFSLKSEKPTCWLCLHAHLSCVNCLHQTEKTSSERLKIISMHLWNLFSNTNSNSCCCCCCCRRRRHRYVYKNIFIIFLFPIQLSIFCMRWDKLISLAYFFVLFSYQSQIRKCNKYKIFCERDFAFSFFKQKQSNWIYIE